MQSPSFFLVRVLQALVMALCAFDCLMVKRGATHVLRHLESIHPLQLLVTEANTCDCVLVMRSLCICSTRGTWC